MPGWKKLIGDAFKLQSRDPRYYTNVFLLWPTLLFSWLLAGVVWKWPLANVNWRSAIIFAALLGACLLFLTERLVVIISLLLYTAYLSYRAIFWGHVRAVEGLELIAICFAVGAVLYFLNRARILRSKAASWPDEFDFLALVCGVGGLIFALVVGFALNRWLQL